MDDESAAEPPPTTRGSSVRPTFSAPGGGGQGATAPVLTPATHRPHTRRGFRADPPAGRTEQPAGEQPVTAVPAGTAPPPRRTNTRWAAAAAGTAAVALVIIAVLAFRLGANSSDPAGRASADAASTANSTATSPTSLGAGDLYRLTVPSVVAITTSKGSLGTGFVVTDKGTIMTANHVISDGGDIAVIFAHGTKSAATLLSGDKATDIATLAPAKLPEVVVPATLGGGVVVGADVVAIGNQLALVDSTTSGIVSGLNRTAKTDAGRLTGLIQFDAAVNPGSSGGPLLNNQGAVVAVVVSIADPGNDDSWSGIGFAVPIGSALGAVGNGPGGPLL